MTVDAVDPVKVKNGWKGLAWDITTSDSVYQSKSTKERFDAVMVCNGYVKPFYSYDDVPVSIPNLCVLKCSRKEFDYKTNVN